MVLYQSGDYTGDRRVATPPQASVKRRVGGVTVQRFPKLEIHGKNVNAYFSLLSALPRVGKICICTFLSSFVFPGEIWDGKLGCNTGPLSEL